MKATLVKRATADGLMDVHDDVPLGKVYDVVPGSRRMVTMQHETGVIHSKEVVDIRGGGYFPADLLQFDEDIESLTDHIHEMLKPAEVTVHPDGKLWFARVLLNGRAYIRYGKTPEDAKAKLRKSIEDRLS